MSKRYFPAIRPQAQANWCSLVSGCTLLLGTAPRVTSGACSQVETTIYERGFGRNTKYCWAFKSTETGSWVSQLSVGLQPPIEQVSPPVNFFFSFGVGKYVEQRPTWHWAVGGFFDVAEIGITNPSWHASGGISGALVHQNLCVGVNGYLPSVSKSMFPQQLPSPEATAATWGADFRGNYAVGLPWARDLDPSALQVFGLLGYYYNHCNGECRVVYQVGAIFYPIPLLGVALRWGWSEHTNTWNAIPNIQFKLHRRAYLDPSLRANISWKAGPRTQQTVDQFAGFERTGRIYARQFPYTMHSLHSYEETQETVAFRQFIADQAQELTPFSNDPAALRYNQFKELLRKLPETREAQVSPGSMTERVRHLVTALKTDGVREHVFNEIEEPRGCGDHDIVRFQRLETAANIGKLELSTQGALDPQEYFKFVRGFTYRAALETFITDEYMQEARAGSSAGARESVETYLAAQIQLHKAYQFPNPPTTMLHGAIAGQAMIDSARRHLAALTTQQLVDCFENLPERDVLSKIITDKLYPEEYLAMRAALREAFTALEDAEDAVKQQVGYEERFHLAAKACQESSMDPPFIREKLLAGFQDLAAPDTSHLGFLTR